MAFIRRKPTVVELRIEDRQQLEEIQKNTLDVDVAMSSPGALERPTVGQLEMEMMQEQKAQRSTKSRIGLKP